MRGKEPKRRSACKASPDVPRRPAEPSKVVGTSPAIGACCSKHGIRTALPICALPPAAKSSSIERLRSVWQPSCPTWDECLVVARRFRRPRRAFDREGYGRPTPGTSWDASGTARQCGECVCLLLWGDLSCDGLMGGVVMATRRSPVRGSDRGPSSRRDAVEQAYLGNQRMPTMGGIEIVKRHGVSARAYRADPRFLAGRRCALRERSDMRGVACQFLERAGPHRPTIDCSARNEDPRCGAYWPACGRASFSPPRVNFELVARDAGMISLVTSPVWWVSRSTSSNHVAIRSRGVDDHRDDRDAATQLPKRVAVRSVLAVVAPDASKAGRSGGARGAEFPDQLVVQRIAIAGGLFACIDHELLPDAEPGGVRRGRSLRLGERMAVAFADPDALEREQRLRQQFAELGQKLADSLAIADRDDHQRNVRCWRRRTSLAGGSRLRCRRPRAAPSPPLSRGGEAGRPPARRRVGRRRAHGGRHKRSASALREDQKQSRPARCARRASARARA